MVIPLVAVLWALGICQSINDSKVNAGTGDEPALPDFFPVQCWTGAHHQHPRPQINLVERR
jgi:hypothetical protein